MIKHLALLDYIYWIIISMLQLKIFWKVKSKVQSLAWSMQYLLVQSLVLFTCTFFSSQFYSKAYYVSGILESLVLSSVAIEFGLKIVPGVKDRIIKWGPAILAVPIFCSLVVFIPFNLSRFMEGVLRVSQVSFVLSLALLLGCFAFEDISVKERKLARSYAALLIGLTGCTELQLKYGLVEWVRTLWPTIWLIGLSGIAYCCRSLGTTKNLTMTNGGAE